MINISWITTSSWKWKGHLIALFAGAITPLFLAPFNIWLLAPVSIAILYLGLQTLSPKQALVRGWCYGFGAYLAGVSWIYVSIHTYGNASTLLAAFLTIAFCMSVAFFFVIPVFIWAKWLRNNQTTFIDTFAFAGLWMLQEWFRGWFLTGFPWLYTGYSQLNGPLAGYAPIGGVWFISFLIAFWTILFIKSLTLHKRSLKFGFSLFTLVAIPCTGLLFNQINWTTSQDKKIPVVLIQGNIAQIMKWDPEFYQHQLLLYRDLTLSHQLNNGLIIWPENAVPYLRENIPDFLNSLNQFEKQHNASLITGLPIAQKTHNQYKYYNGITVLGEGQGTYLKQKLVPFGEYVPLEETLRGVISFFDLPMSNFTKGPAKQSPLQAQGQNIAPFICYEVVYPDFAATLSAQSNLLLTISNDTWFGDSIGPKQHLQMAQMRALESGRWMIRATNNGITALINNKGAITQTVPAFKEAILKGTVETVTGKTPYLIWRSYPLLFISFLGILIGFITRKRDTA